MPMLLILLLGLISAITACAQTADTSLNQAIKLAIHRHQLSKGASAPIYNGIEHRGYPDFFHGIAYFESKEFQPGEIFFDGSLYTSAFLMYDMVQDKVIIRHYDGLSQIELFGPRIQYFKLQNIKFIFVPPAEDHELEGFYQELSEGEITLLAKRVKVLDEHMTSTAVVRSFVQKNMYYLKAGGIYFPVANEKTVLQLAGNRKKNLQNFLKEKKLKYKREPENTLVEIVSFYNSLTR